MFEVDGLLRRPFFIKLIMAALVLLVLFHARFKNVEVRHKTLFANNIPISQATAPDIGVNYYADLARSFLHGHTYLLGPYHPEIAIIDNPYGVEAYEKKIIIQDASYFEGRYYLYFGPLPAVLHAVGRIVTGSYLTDWIVGNFFLVMVFFGFLKILTKIDADSNLIASNRKYAILCISLMFANPVMANYLLAFANSNALSRIMAIYLFLFGLWWAAFAKDDKELILGLVLMGLSILCKYNFFVNVCLAYLFIYLKHKKAEGFNVRKVSASALFVLGGVMALHLVYNYVRFGSALDFGMKYQTNSLDFVHNGSPLIIHPKLGFIVVSIIERAYEYFFSFPTFDASENVFRLNHVPLLQINDRFYNEGFVGLFVACPVTIYLACKFYTYSKDLEYSSSVQRAAPMLAMLAYTAGVYFFFILSFVFYSSEILLGIMCVLIALPKYVGNYLSENVCWALLVAGLLAVPLIRS
jgi:hypothetical protein